MAEKGEKADPRHILQRDMTKQKLAKIADHEAAWQKRIEESDRKTRELKERYTFWDAMEALRHDADPVPLMWHLRNGKPLPPEHAEELADLFDPKASRPPVVAKISFRKKAPPTKSKQQRQIYNAVMHLRGNDWANRMPPGAWDAVAAHFKLSRKAVETASQKERAKVEEYNARPDVRDEETAAGLRAEGWSWDEDDILT